MLKFLAFEYDKSHSLVWLCVRGVFFYKKNLQVFLLTSLNLKQIVFDLVDNVFFMSFFKIW